MWHFYSKSIKDFSYDRFLYDFMYSSSTIKQDYNDDFHITIIKNIEYWINMSIGFPNFLSKIILQAAILCFATMVDISF